MRKRWALMKARLSFQVGAAEWVQMDPFICSLGYDTGYYYSKLSEMASASWR
jgi:hypothetical protein